MALTAQITNPSYSYLGDGAVSYSAQLVLKLDEAIVGGTSLTVGTNVTVPGWNDVIAEGIAAQAQAYIDQFKLMMMVVNSVYPEATKPEDAVEAITVDANSRLVI